MPNFFVLRCMGEPASGNRRHFTLSFQILSSHALRHFRSHAAEIEAAASKLEAGGRARGRSREAVYAAIECVVALWARQSATHPVQSDGGCSLKLTSAPPFDSALDAKGTPELLEQLVFTVASAAPSLVSGQHVLYCLLFGSLDRLMSTSPIQCVLYTHHRCRRRRSWPS
jgi:hypothetical protein